jgi:Uma2 family endonuclease
MATVEWPQTRATLESEGPPLLRSGDRLDQPTFHAIYETMPDGFKAELIEGTVFVAPQVTEDHSADHAAVVVWAGFYQAHTPGVLLNADGTVILGPQNQPQPDGALRIDPARGGQTRVENHFIVGPPELAIEVAYSSRAIDLNAKFDAYQAAGIREYLIVVAQDPQVLWYALSEGRYEPIAPGPDGILRSWVFPGLWLDPLALLRGDLLGVFASLNLGLATPEHAAFVAKLNAAGGTGQAHLT